MITRILEITQFLYCHEKIRVLAAQLPEIDNRFSGNDHDVLCALGDITLGHSPTGDSFDLVARYYNLIKELLPVPAGGATQ